MGGDEGEHGVDPLKSLDDGAFVAVVDLDKRGPVDGLLGDDVPSREEDDFMFPRGNESVNDLTGEFWNYIVNTVSMNTVRHNSRPGPAKATLTILAM